MCFFGTLLSDLQVLLTSGFLLSLKFLAIDFLSLFFENSLDKDSSVFELITLWSKVKFVIQSAIDFLSFSVFSEQSSENSLSSHPKDFSGHSAFHRASAFTSTSMITFTFSLKMKSSTCAWVNNLFSLHDKTVLDKFTNEDSGVSLTDLFNLVGIHPNSLLSTFQNFSS